MTSGDSLFAASTMACTCSTAFSSGVTLQAPLMPPPVTPIIAPTTSAPAAAMRAASSGFIAHATVKMSRSLARRISSTSLEKPIPACSSWAAKLSPYSPQKGSLLTPEKPSSRMRSNSRSKFSAGSCAPIPAMQGVRFTAGRISPAILSMWLFASP